MRQALILLLSLLLAPLSGQAAEASWTTNHEPFRILGNVYYVGSKDLASYLIATPQGLILINSNLPSSVPQIRANVEKLGFHLRDIKVLLISQAHFDHDAGAAELKRLTGAKYEVMQGDADVVESGGRTDFQYGREKKQWYAPAKVDRVLHDGDTVASGGVVLTAHKTAGHTRGCTTWTLQVPDGGRMYHVVIVGGPSANDGYRLRGDPNYPTMAADLATQYRTLAALPCDVFLGAHGQYFGMAAKFARLQAGDRLAFVDPDGYHAMIARRQADFERRLAAYPAASPQKNPGTR